MLEQQDDCGYGQFRSECGDEVSIDNRCTNVLQASRNGLQNLDRIFPRTSLPVPAIQPGGNGENDDDEGVTEC